MKPCFNEVRYKNLCLISKWKNFLLHSMQNISFTMVWTGYVDQRVHTLMMQWKSFLEKVLTWWQHWQLQARYKPPAYTKRQITKKNVYDSVQASWQIHRETWSINKMLCMYPTTGRAGTRANGLQRFDNNFQKHFIPTASTKRLIACIMALSQSNLPPSCATQPFC